MSDKTVRTRYAPSPTGFMHVGNLRTALYEYLVAKSQNGKFVLRIEDTDRERLVEGAVDVIYNTLKLAGLKHDEGPDVGGDFGPYVQSERKGMYLPYAEQLIKEGKADVKVLDTPDKWFGVTYQADRECVQDALKKLVEGGVYPEKLF